MRIAVFSDVHLDARTAGVERLPEIRSFVARMCEEIATEGVEGAICLGDLYDPGGDELRMATALGDLVVAVHVAARGRSLWLAGNHDVGTGGMTTLSPLAALAPLVPGLEIAERPRLVPFEEVMVLCLPHPGRDSPEWREEVRHVVDVAAAAADAGAAIIAAIHLSLRPAAWASESDELARGTEVYLDVGELARCRPRLVVGGHYHAGQIVVDGPIEIVIPGSPLRYRFDEREDHEKGYFVINTSG